MVLVEIGSLRYYKITVELSSKLQMDEPSLKSLTSGLMFLRLRAF